MAQSQCPGVRPVFKWANDGSAIVFTDLTAGQIDERMWVFGDGDTAYNAVETHHYEIAAPDTVELTVYSFGCVFTIAAPVVHGGANDACNSQLASSFSADPSGNNNMVFTDSSQGDGSFLYYLWTFGDGGLGWDPNAEHFYPSPGAYDVSHSIATVDSLFQTACVAGSAERVFVDGNTSTCDSSLFLNLSLQPNGNLVTCTAQAVLFNDDLMITSWQWEYGDGYSDITGISSTDHYYPNGGDVQVCVQVTAQDTTGGDPCFARTCLSLSFPPTVGMEEIRDHQTLRARPVPFDEDLWVEGGAVRIGARWQLMDVLGRELFSGTLVHDDTEHLEFRTLPTGVYTLVVPLERGVRSLRLLKQ